MASLSEVRPKYLRIVAIASVSCWLKRTVRAFCFFSIPEWYHLDTALSICYPLCSTLTTQSRFGGFSGAGPEGKIRPCSPNLRTRCTTRWRLPSPHKHQEVYARRVSFFSRRAGLPDQRASATGATWARPVDGRASASPNCEAFVPQRGNQLRGSRSEPPVFYA